MSACGILHNDPPFILDTKGCLLPDGHDGPHEFADQEERHWLWETDLECECWHCERCEGDYCTVYWRKPSTTKDQS